MTYRITENRIERDLSILIVVHPAFLSGTVNFHINNEYLIGS